jgi:hypothetical protein
MGDNLNRKIYFVFFLIVGLCSCNRYDMINSLGDYSEQLDTRKQHIMVWATAEKTKVDAGTLKNSEYWRLFFRKAIELRPDLDNYLFFANEMIKVSRIFEEGKITREQFEDKHRQLTALLDQEDRRRAAILSRRQLLLYEMELFYAYRDSLFRDYENNLRRQLTEAGPQFSNTNCAVFGDSIQCTTLSPIFP